MAPVSTQQSPSWKFPYPLLPVFLFPAPWVALAGAGAEAGRRWLQAVLGPFSCRQEPEEHGLFRMYQSWEDRSDEHLTLKQEEGEHLTVLTCCPTAPLSHTAALLSHTVAPLIRFLTPLPH